MIANERGYSSREKVTRLLKRHIRHTLGVLPDQDLIEYRQEKGIESKNGA